MLHLCILLGPACRRITQSVRGVTRSWNRSDKRGHSKAIRTICQMFESCRFIPGTRQTTAVRIISCHHPSWSSHHPLSFVFGGNCGVRNSNISEITLPRISSSNKHSSNKRPFSLFPRVPDLVAALTPSPANVQHNSSNKYTPRTDHPFPLDDLDISGQVDSPDL